PDRPPRGPRVRRAHAADDGDGARVPRALLGGGAPRRRGARDLLALRRHHVGDRLHDDLRDLGRGVLNPLRSEAEAFRFLIWVVVVVGVIVGGVLVIRAVS